MCDIIIRPYEHWDEQEINRSFNQIFNQNRSMEEWRWKFGPGGDASCIMIGIDSNGEVISQWAEVLVPMRIDGRNIKAAQAVDGFCLDRPEFERRPTFIKTVHKFYEKYGEASKQIPFFYGTAGPRLFTVGKQAVGLKGFVSIDYYCKETIRFIRPLSMVMGNYVWNAMIPETKVSLQDIDSLWESSKGRYGVTLQKNGAYFQRRYITHPLIKYMIIPSYKDNKLAGLAVLSYGARVVKLRDLLWDGRAGETVSSLLEKAWNVTRKTGAVKLEMWLNNDDGLVELLNSHGMVKEQNPYTLKLISCSFDDCLDPGDIAGRFCLTMGDTDLL
jgi:hypothetical protein